VPTRCLIVDDNESFLEAVRVLLEREGMSVAAVASTYADALAIGGTISLESRQGFGTNVIAELPLDLATR